MLLYQGYSSDPPPPSDYQLELWTGGKTYIADPATADASTLAERGRGILANKTVANVRGWRVVSLDKPRPIKPTYKRPPRSTRPDRDADTVIRAYLDWALTQGLATVSVYASGPNSWLAICRAEQNGFAVNKVDPNDWTEPAVNEFVYTDCEPCYIGV